MSLLLITNPPTVLALDTDWNLLLTRSNANMLGHGLSIPIFTLTNWDSSTIRPEIAQGSVIEVGGSFYQADSDTALVDDAGLIDGTVHIKLIPSGEATPLTLSPVLTNDVIPAWDANKAGWYTSNVKYLPFEMEKGSTVFTLKSEFIDKNKTIKISPEGFFDLAVKNDLVVSGLMSSGEILKTGLSTEGTWNISTTPFLIPEGDYTVFPGSVVDAFVSCIISGIPRAFTTLNFSCEQYKSDGVNFYIQKLSGTASVSWRRR